MLSSPLLLLLLLQIYPPLPLDEVSLLVQAIKPLVVGGGGGGGGGGGMEGGGTIATT